MKHVVESKQAKFDTFPIKNVL